MTLKEMIESLRTNGERVEVRDENNYELLTCSTDSEVLRQFYDYTVKEWFPHPAPFKQCDFTVLLDCNLLDCNLRATTTQRRYHMIDVLLETLRQVKDKNTKAFILEKYVQEFGAIPNEYAEEIRKALEAD